MYTLKSVREPLLGQTSMPAPCSSLGYALEKNIQWFFLPEDEGFLCTPIPHIFCICQLEVKCIDESGENKTHLSISK